MGAPLAGLGMVVETTLQALNPYDFRIDRKTPVTQTHERVELVIWQLLTGGCGVGKKCQWAFGRQLRIQLPQAAGSAIAWIHQWFLTALQRLAVESLEPVTWHVNLTTHFQQIRPACAT